jgi:hypothetical protein
MKIKVGRMREIIKEEVDRYVADRQVLTEQRHLSEAGKGFKLIQAFMSVVDKGEFDGSDVDEFVRYVSMNKDELMNLVAESKSEDAEGV